MKGEFRSAIAQLRRRPGFVLGATLSLAIGMSLATAVFSVVDTVLLRRLPFPDADRLVAVTVADNKNLEFAFVGAKLGLAARDARSFSQVTTWTPVWGVQPTGGYYNGVFIGDAATGRRVAAAYVAPNFFDVLRMRPMIGSGFEAADALPGSRGVIIDYSLWSSYFASNNDVIGKRVTIDDSVYYVLGVMPDKFDFPRGTRIWLPDPKGRIERGALNEANAVYLGEIGRLAPGASVKSASAELAAIHHRVYLGDIKQSLTARATPLADWVTMGLRDQLRLWVMAAILVGILCAVNFATMSLARGMQRRGEIAVRAALGASTRRIVRLLVAEAVVIAVAGGLIAVVLASWWLSFAGMWFANGEMPVQPHMSWGTVAFGVAATVGVGFVFALFPAIELAAVDLRSMLQGNSTAVTSRSRELRGRRALVALQLCLALTGIAVVTAVIQADKRWQRFAPGFDYSQLLRADVVPRDTSVRLDLEDVTVRLRRMPGVVDVAYTRRGIGGAAWTDQWGSRQSFGAGVFDVSPSYFHTLGVQPLAGRLPLDDEIRSGAPVVVASESVAKLMFGCEACTPSASGPVADAIGKTFHIKAMRRPVETFTIIGVVPDLRGAGVWSFASSFYSMRQLPITRGSTVVVRVTGEPHRQLKNVAAAFSGIGPRVSVSAVHVVRDDAEQELGATRGRTIFLGSVAALALALAIIGVFGLTSYTTELRARELGIRIALGAGRVRLARAVFGDLWWMSLLAVVVGVMASSQLTIFLDSLFYNPFRKGPLIVLQTAPTLACAATLVLIAIVGTTIPLRRVLRMDVMRVVQSG